MPNYTAGVLLALFSAIGFATLPIFVKIAYEAGMNTNTLLTLRFAFSVLLLLITLKLRGISPLMPGRQAGILLLLGVLGFATTSLAFTEALQYLSASLTSIVFHIYPTLVAVFAFLVGDERPNLKTFLALVVCFVGLILVVGISFASISFTGVMLAIVSALLYAVYAVVGNHVRKQLNALIVTLYICVAATLVFLTSGMIQGDLSFNLTPVEWWTMLGMALFGTLIGIYGFFNSMSRIGATKTCIISTSEPVFTVIFALLLLGERMDMGQIMGGILILSSIIILQFQN